MALGFPGVFGVFALFFLGFLLSKHKRAICWSSIAKGFILQWIFAVLTLRFSFGQELLRSIALGADRITTYVAEGTNFVFGGLTSPGSEISGRLGFVFALRVLPLIVFFGAFTAVLFYLRILPVIIRFLGGALGRVIGTTGVESFAAAATIFVGINEAPLIIRPFLADLTESELFAVMVAGLTSTSGTVLLSYSQMGVALPYLITATFMAAPGSLVMAKLLLPETQDSRIAITKGVDLKGGYADSVNVIDAAARGTIEGTKLAVSVGAMLIAFLSLLAMLNGILASMNVWFGLQSVSLQSIFGSIFAPIAALLGVPAAHWQTAGSLLGQKIALNEFVAFSTLQTVKSGFDARTEAILTVALTGFANLGSIAILTGGIGALAPDRRSDVARLGLRALAAATLANLMSATLVGLTVGS